MKKTFLLGILWLVFNTLQAQSWKEYYDSTSLFWDSDWTKAISLLHKAENTAALSIGKNDAQYIEILNDLAVAYWKIDEYEKAGEFLTSSLILQPELSYHDQQNDLLNTLNHFALWKASNGDTPIARVILRTLIFNPNARPESVFFSSAVHNLIMMYENSNLPDSALEVWNYVNENHPSYFRSNSEWIQTGARLTAMKGDSDEAIMTLEKLKKGLVKSSNKNNTAYITTLSLLGELYLQEDRYDRAIEYLQKASKGIHTSTIMVPGSRESVYMNLVLAYREKQAPKKALAICDHYLMSYGGRAENKLAALDFSYQRAALFHMMSDHSKAIEGYEELIQLYPKYIAETDPLFIKLLTDVAQAYVESGQPHRAYIYLRWAYEMINTRDTYHSGLAVDVINNLAELYAAKGEIVLAEQHHQEALVISNALR